MTQAQPNSQEPLTQHLLEPLTNKEREVAWLVSFALTDREIASKLFVTVDTVKTHIKSICGKLGVSNRTGICRWVLMLYYENKITLLGNVL